MTEADCLTRELASCQSFRQNARAWLQKTPREPGAPLRAVEAGDGHVVVAEAARCPDALSCEEVLVLRGDLTTGTGCRFTRHLYVGGNCRIGQGSQLEAIAAEGDLDLGSGVSVRLWAHSRGILEIHTRATIEQEVSSETAIRLGLDVTAGSLSGPEVGTQSWEEGIAPPPCEPPTEFIEIPSPSGAGAPDSLSLPGVDPMRLFPMGPQTWVYNGDLHLEKPLILHAKLVVDGSFSCPAHSRLEDDVRSANSIHTGPNSVIGAQLIARTDLVLGPGCVFHSGLRAGKTLRLCRGVVGGKHGSTVEVSACGSLMLESGVVIRGKLSAGGKVVTVTTQPPQTEPPKPAKKK